jgi:hypothetical protein
VNDDISPLLALDSALKSQKIADLDKPVRFLMRRNPRGVRVGIMPSAGLSGPYLLDSETVDAIVGRKSAGAYALGRSEGETFYIRFVGRSDGDVAARLRAHLGDYQQFKFGYFGAPKAAFDKECHLYHDFGESKLDNRLHPARPGYSRWQCPRCRIFDY